MLRVLAVSLALLGSLPPAVAATPRLAADDGARATRAHRQLLRSTLELSAAAPSMESLRQARAAMREIERVVDVYFHAGNLGDAGLRVASHGLRTSIWQMLGGQEGVLVVHDDVVRFRPAIHRALAAASRALGTRREEAEHLRLAMAVEGPTLADLAALLAATQALGDARSSAAIEAEIAALRTASIEDAPLAQ